MDCPYYDDCLTRAAIPNWLSWTCENCPALVVADSETIERFIVFDNCGFMKVDKK